MQKLLILIVLVALTIPARSQKANNSAWPPSTNESKPFTRWWWFGSAVDNAGLQYNLQELSKAGFGGVEITPIYGVKGFETKNVNYLSPEWMQYLEYTITEAKKLGIQVEMATGTGWPFGGPQISPENAASKLIIQTIETKEGQYVSETLKLNDKNQEKTALIQAVMAFSDKGEKVNLYNKINEQKQLNWLPGPGNWKIIIVYCGKTLQKVKRPAPGGDGLVIDHFNQKSFATYAARFNDAFNTSKCPVPAVFFNDSYEVYNADWSPNFFAEFNKHRGYRLEDHLDFFTENGDPDAIARVKSDYRETMSELLLEQFTSQWTNWAHDKNALTRNQAHGSPGNLIDLYATVDIPECESFGTTPYDIPGLRYDSAFIRPGDADPFMLKFASSGAHISGKNLVSSETFTWLGEHFRISLSQCKPQLDDIFTSGINHVFFHGTPYSPANAKWPGWEFYASVNFSPQNRFWTDINGLTGYIERCQRFLQWGVPDNDILVYFPIYDLWYNPKGTDMPFAIHSIDKWLHNTSFYNTIVKLNQLGYATDYISDRYLKMAKVNGNMVSTGGNNYKAIIVPQCRFMPVETLDALLKLAQSGAKVVFVDLPMDVPGLGNIEAKYKQFKSLTQDLGDIPMKSQEKMADYGKGKLAIGVTLDKINQLLNIDVEEFTSKHIKFIRRKNTDGYHYFLANLNSKPVDYWFTLGTSAKSAQLFNPLNGNVSVAAIQNNNGKSTVRIQLNPGESVILKTYLNKQVSGKNFEYVENSGTPIILDKNWKLSFKKGIPEISSVFDLNELKSWTDLPDSSLRIFSGTGVYHTEFEIPEPKAGNWILSLGEVRESARVKINGKQLETLWSVPFTCAVGEFLKPGKNTLDIEVTNIDANRIRSYDQNKIPWKIFNDINVVNVNYKPFDASEWPVMPAGLLGPVTLTPVNLK